MLLYVFVFLALWTLQRGFLLDHRHHHHPAAVVRECPALTTNWTGIHDSSHLQLYEEQSQQIAQNWTDFMANFRNSSIDEWGKTYQQIKLDLYDWKVEHYVPYLKSGNVIFESASGVGLNLILTLEVLEEHGLRNIRVEGNDFARSSVQLANRVLHEVRQGSSSGNTNKSHLICVADSTNLYYIPSHSYDLVFCGYVTPHDDPLDLQLGNDMNFRRLEQVCPNSKKLLSIGWKDAALHHLAQLRQEDWFGKWVGEMVRIAKPGAPIIVEQVSPPFCEATHDWGGVSRSFWKEAIGRYHWDVNSSSLEFGNDDAFRTRYHVFMRKNE